MDDLRVRLIERLCRLPHAALADVQTLFDNLEAKSHPSAPPVLLVAKDGPKDWPHAPVHRLSEGGTFIVTASTLHKQHLFQGTDRLTFLESQLLSKAKQHEVLLEAWAVFSNHYHVVAHTVGTQNQLADFISDLHSATATEINQRDATPGRPVWFNYWDTQLTFEKSYLARLSYVHQNPVKHGLVRRAQEYLWCSAAWFERTATRAQVQTIYSFKIDRVKINDDYEPVL